MTTPAPRLPVWLSLCGSGLAGMLVATQSRINGGLSLQLGNPYVTAAVSFGIGMLVILVVLLLNSRARRGISMVRLELARRRLPLWALTGGACGAFFVLTQGLVATSLGLALFTVGIVAGQVLGGLIFDRAGVGPGGKVALSSQRMIGTALAILAVALSVIADLIDAESGTHLLLMLVPVLAGVGVAFQSAVNGLVRSAAQHALTATFFNFLVGTVVLVIAAAVSIGISGWPEHWPSDPWYYTGGAVGVVFIAIASVLVRTAGVLLLSMSNVAGQLLASVAFEAVAPFAGGLSAGLLAGVAVALVAVFIAAIPVRRGH